MNVPVDADTVAVPVFDNDTFQPELGRLMTAALLREIQRNHRVLLAREKNADIVIRGNVKQYSESPIAFDPNGFAVAYSVRVTVDVEVRKKGSVIVKYSDLSWTEEYNTTGNPLDTEVMRRQALASLADNLMEKTHRILFEAF